MSRWLGCIVAVSLALSPGISRGDGNDYFDRDESAGEMTFRVDKPRPRKAWMLIGGLGGAALAFGGTGLLLHLSAGSKADEVTSNGPTGLIWTRERQDTYDSSVLRRKLGYGAFAIGGGLLIATTVAFIVTDPGSKLIRVGNEEDTSATSFDLVPGGALVRRGWSF